VNEESLYGQTLDCGREATPMQTSGSTDTPQCNMIAMPQYIALNRFNLLIAYQLLTYKVIVLIFY